MERSNIFGNIDLPLIWYLVIVVLVLLVFLFAALYIFWVWHQGRPLREFFTVRIKNLFGGNIVLYEIFGITNNIELKVAHVEEGDGYRLGEHKYKDIPNPTKKGWLGKILSIILKDEKKEQSEAYKNKKTLLIIPKSTYSINGVKTIPLWNIHPKLHEDLLKGVDILIEKHITTLEQLENIIDDTIKAEEILFDNYTYKNWHELYLANKNKYTVNIYSTDLDKFVEKNYDANFRRSIYDQDFILKKQKSKVETYDKYGLIGVGVVLLVICIRVLYLTFYR